MNKDNPSIIDALYNIYLDIFGPKRPPLTGGPLGSTRYAWISASSARVRHLPDLPRNSEFGSGLFGLTMSYEFPDDWSQEDIANACFYDEFRLLADITGIYTGDGHACMAIMRVGRIISVSVVGRGKPRIHEAIEVRLAYEDYPDEPYYLELTLSSRLRQNPYPMVPPLCRVVESDPAKLISAFLGACILRGDGPACRGEFGARSVCFPPDFWGPLPGEYEKIKSRAKIRACDTDSFSPLYPVESVKDPYSFEDYRFVSRELRLLSFSYELSGKDFEGAWNEGVVYEAFVSSRGFPVRQIIEHYTALGAHCLSRYMEGWGMLEVHVYTRDPLTIPAYVDFRGGIPVHFSDGRALSGVLSGGVHLKWSPPSFEEVVSRELDKFSGYSKGDTSYSGSFLMWGSPKGNIFVKAI